MTFICLLNALVKSQFTFGDYYVYYLTLVNNLISLIPSRQRPIDNAYLAHAQ
jgi:hypothetical protein